VSARPYNVSDDFRFVFGLCPWWLDDREYKGLDIFFSTRNLSSAFRIVNKTKKNKNEPGPARHGRFSRALPVGTPPRAASDRRNNNIVTFVRNGGGARVFGGVRDVRICGGGG